MRKLGWGSIVVLAMLSANANAGKYWSVQYNAVTLGDDTATEAAPAFGIVDFSYGWTFAEYFVLEANLIWNTVNRNRFAHDKGVRINDGQGLSIGAHKKFLNDFDAYAMLSYNILHVDNLAGANTWDNGVGYVGGISYDVPHGAVFFEYVSLMDNARDVGNPDALEAVSAVGIGYKLDLSF